MKYKGEVFSVPSERLTDEEMRRAAWQTYRNADSVYAEDQGVWETFEEYLAFRIGVESIQYVWEQGGREEMERFATAVLALNNSEDR